MSRIRTGRRTYYNLFSSVYDGFVKLHARGEGSDTRTFLVDAIQAEVSIPRAILDLCCGTGAVILACAKRYPESLLIGYDFSRGMLRHARTKPESNCVVFIEGDAASLPFLDNCFDVVTCSHALYELQGQARQMALQEMKRVVCPTGVVCLMEHEVPHHPVLKMLFTLRMLMMGSSDAREFVHAGLRPFTAIFPEVSLTHSPSGKTKLVLCRKQKTNLRTSKN
jgi:ubiquinone/menaquinone biosynthesis C-methylase UbiE